jgi:hypothetical protein
MPILIEPRIDGRGDEESPSRRVTGRAGVDLSTYR